MTFPVFRSRPTAIFTYLTSTSGSCVERFDCGHGLTSVAQLSVINIADIRSALDKTLSSEHFRRNAVDDAP